MAKIEIYTSPFCGFCYSAKALLKKKGAEFTEINVMFHPTKRPEMIERAGGEAAAESPVMVHNDHRIVVNYNASSRAARHRQLTQTDTERERTGAL